jgi:hypothetical protein
MLLYFIFLYYIRDIKFIRLIIKIWIVLSFIGVGLEEGDSTLWVTVADESAEPGEWLEMPFEGIDPQRVVCRFDVSAVFDDEIGDVRDVGDEVDDVDDLEDDLDTELDEDEDLEPLDVDR